MSCAFHLLVSLVQPGIAHDLHCIPVAIIAKKCFNSKFRSDILMTRQATIATLCPFLSVPAAEVDRDNHFY